MAKRRPAKSRSAAPLAAEVTAPDLTRCPCGLTGSYDDCCGALHRGEAKASTAERLMRSRYTAFVVHDAAYLMRSWHPSTRPPQIDFDPGLRWQGLEVLRTAGGTPFNSEGTVEFRAHYSQGGGSGELHETSRFVRHEGTWVYLDGAVF